MKILYAKDARTLANYKNTIGSVLCDATSSVESAANLGKFSVDYYHDRKFKTDGGGSTVAAKLRDLGFIVDDSDVLDAEGRSLRVIRISW